MRVGPAELAPGEFELRLQPKEGIASAALPGNDAVVVLDTEVTTELRAEGQVRDLVRLVNQARKDADLHIADRILLHVEATEDIAAAVAAHQAYLVANTLAEGGVQIAPPGEGMFTSDANVDGTRVTVGIAKV